MDFAVAVEAFADHLEKCVGSLSGRPCIWGTRAGRAAASRAGRAAGRLRRRSCRLRPRDRAAWQCGQAVLVAGVEVRAAASLAEVAASHGAEVEVPDVEPVPRPQPPEDKADERDLSDVVGQEEAVEALIVAAAGGHNMLLSGPPGAGKTMLAGRLPGIMPPLTTQEAIEVASVRSLCGEAVTGLDHQPPLVTPHHSASVAAMVGGGSRTARPGAVARAHRGVLFLDEASNAKSHTA